MAVWRKKVCLLGRAGVGKTSLCRRFVEGAFSDVYASTIGVQLWRKEVELDTERVQMVLWDVQGDDDLLGVHASYLVGSSGIIWVGNAADSHTVDALKELRERFTSSVGSIPSRVLLNKIDLLSAADAADAIRRAERELATPVLPTSAKTGAHVEDSFTALAQAMLREGGAQ